MGKSLSPFASFKKKSMQRRFWHIARAESDYERDYQKHWEEYQKQLQLTASPASIMPSFSSAPPDLAPLVECYQKLIPIAFDSTHPQQTAAQQCIEEFKNYCHLLNQKNQHLVNMQKHLDAWLKEDLSSTVEKPEGYFENIWNGEYEQDRKILAHFKAKIKKTQKAIASNLTACGFVAGTLDACYQALDPGEPATLRADICKLDFLSSAGSEMQKVMVHYFECQKKLLQFLEDTFSLEKICRDAATLSITAQFDELFKAYDAARQPFVQLDWQNFLADARSDNDTFEKACKNMGDVSITHGFFRPEYGRFLERINRPREDGREETNSFSFNEAYVRERVEQALSFKLREEATVIAQTYRASYPSLKAFAKIKRDFQLFSTPQDIEYLLMCLVGAVEKWLTMSDFINHLKTVSAAPWIVSQAEQRAAVLTQAIDNNCLFFIRELEDLKATYSDVAINEQLEKIWKSLRVRDPFTQSGGVISEASIQETAKDFRQNVLVPLAQKYRKTSEEQRSLNRAVQLSQKAARSKFLKIARLLKDVNETTEEIAGLIRLDSSEATDSSNVVEQMKAASQSVRDYVREKTDDVGFQSLLPLVHLYRQLLFRTRQPSMMDSHGYDVIELIEHYAEVVYHQQLAIKRLQNKIDYWLSSNLYEQYQSYIEEKSDLDGLETLRQAFLEEIRELSEIGIFFNAFSKEDGENSIDNVNGLVGFLESASFSNAAALEKLTCDAQQLFALTPAPSVSESAPEGSGNQSLLSIEEAYTALAQRVRKLTEYEQQFDKQKLMKYWRQRIAKQADIKVDLCKLRQSRQCLVKDDTHLLRLDEKIEAYTFNCYVSLFNEVRELYESCLHCYGEGQRSNPGFIGNTIQEQWPQNVAQAQFRLQRSFVALQSQLPPKDEREQAMVRSMQMWLTAMKSPKVFAAHRSGMCEARTVLFRFDCQQIERFKTAQPWYRFWGSRWQLRKYRQLMEKINKFLTAVNNFDGKDQTVRNELHTQYQHLYQEFMRRKAKWLAIQEKFRENQRSPVDLYGLASAESVLIEAAKMFPGLTPPISGGRPSSKSLELPPTLDTKKTLLDLVSESFSKENSSVLSTTATERNLSLTGRGIVTTIATIPTTATGVDDTATMVDDGTDVFLPSGSDSVILPGSLIPALLQLSSAAHAFASPDGGYLVFLEAVNQLPFMINKYDQEGRACQPPQGQYEFFIPPGTRLQNAEGKEIGEAFTIESFLGGLLEAASWLQKNPSDSEVGAVRTALQLNCQFLLMYILGTLQADEDVQCATQRINGYLQSLVPQKQGAPIFNVKEFMQARDEHPGNYKELVQKFLDEVIIPVVVQSTSAHTEQGPDSSESSSAESPNAHTLFWPSPPISPRYLAKEQFNEGVLTPLTLMLAVLEKEFMPNEPNSPIEESMAVLKQLPFASFSDQPYEDETDQATDQDTDSMINHQFSSEVCAHERHKAFFTLFKASGRLPEQKYGCLGLLLNSLVQGECKGKWDIDDMINKIEQYTHHDQYSQFMQDSRIKKLLDCILHGLSELKEKKENFNFREFKDQLATTMAEEGIEQGHKAARHDRSAVVIACGH